MRDDGVLTAFGRPERRRRALICIPHAGAGASAFAPWAGALRSAAAVWAARLPGRETLIGEPPLRTVGDMAGRLVSAVADVAAAELTIFGHCGGAVIAYELARRLTASGQRRVSRLIVSSQPAPSACGPAEPVAGPSREEFVAFLRSMGGTDETVLSHPRYLALLEPVFRADLAAAAGYRLPPDRARLDLPVTAIGGRSDSVVPRRRLDEWAGLTTGPFDVRQFDGDHFFLFAQGEPVLRFLRAVLTAGSGEPDQVCG